MPPLDLSVVIPCHNEEANILPLHAALCRACAGITAEFLFVDDASRDGTAEALRRLLSAPAPPPDRDAAPLSSLRVTPPPALRILSLAWNSGHQAALLAGIRAARGRFVLTLDADLQHPPALIPAMLQKGREGFEVVQMVRKGSPRSWTKKLFSRGFYRLFRRFTGIALPPDAADFRLIDRTVADTLSALPERRLLLRAILPCLGFRTAYLPYEEKARHAGRPSFGFFRSGRLGLDALLSFSPLPLTLGFWTGLSFASLAFLYGLYNVAAHLSGAPNVPGYTDIIASVLFLGGLLLLFQGLQGRYLLHILSYLQGRPEYRLREEDGGPPVSDWAAAAEPAFKGKPPVTSP